MSEGGPTSVGLAFYDIMLECQQHDFVGKFVDSMKQRLGGGG